jgi:hypothetical protein
MIRRLTIAMPFLQCIGAAIAAYQIFAVILSNGMDVLSGALGIIIAIMTMIFGLGVVGAICIWRGISVGLLISGVHQLFLIPLISMKEMVALQLQDLLTFFLVLTFLGNEVGFEFAITLKLDNVFVFLPTDETTIVGVNFIALVMAVYFFSVWKKGVALRSNS